ncbi:MAG: ribose 5-phosphate isomerase B [Acidobacteria bacterium]|nr:ribose 5-phosphate isomerase B [Acidobacteriota bacterium]
MMVAIGSDHAGFKLKSELKRFLEAQSIEVLDLGCPDENPNDYPDVARELAGGVSAGRYEQGILICGSGIGMSIAANRFPGVRAALCCDEDMARLSRQHNDSNILVLGARLTTAEQARRIVEKWMATGFEGGRHLRRINKIDGEQT